MIIDKPISELVRSLLARRGVVEDTDITAFLSPDYEAHTHAPELLNDMRVAVARIFTAMEKNERIAVYADYDCDGIPGAAILSDFFAKINYTNIEVYLPHRDREGYGFHTEAITELSNGGVKLIITVDVGTVAREGCAFAKSLGIDVIVTDHHEIIGERPSCLALVNPKIHPYPFPGLCGAAVAFKLAQAVLSEGKNRKLKNFTAIPDGWEKWLLDLVAIATVADMVPLTGENRALVHWGLKVLRRSTRHGIRALCTRLRLRQSEISEDDIGFSIAPRVNAASRMDEPELAFRLLVTQDRSEATRLITRLEELNNMRKVAVASIVKVAKRTVRTRFHSGDRVVVLGSPDWKPALLGLAANSIMDERGGVVCLWGRDANGRIKGSCRSDGSISVVELFSKASSALIEFGGHHASGGFTVSYEHVHTLHESLTSASLLVTKSDVSDNAKYDASISLADIGGTFLKEIFRLAPFGIGNPKPVFLISPIIISSVRRFGRDNSHAEILVSCKKTGISMRAFDFFRAPDDFTHLPVQGNNANILASVVRDTFRGGIALRLLDVLASNTR